jgi:hypothetical protein
MLPGPDQIFECPSCGAPVAQPTISSGNTIGATYYTDGWMDAPMLPQPALLVRCPGCAAPFVGALARRLGAYDRYGANLFPGEADDDPPDPSWRRARRVALAPLVDYAAMLTARRFERGLELALRLEAWHVGNHARRGPPAGANDSALTAAEVANLRGLMRLLDAEDAEHRVMLAEGHRELGEFDRALAVLAGESPEELALAAGRIRALAEARQARVAVLCGGGED